VALIPKGECRSILCAISELKSIAGNGKGRKIDGAGLGTIWGRVPVMYSSLWIRVNARGSRTAGAGPAESIRLTNAGPARRTD